MTTIEWTDKTWNPIRGCSVVSAGCTNCYAMKQAHRFSGPGGAYEGLTTLTNGGPVWTGDVRLVPEALSAPLRWRKPRRVFVNSMSDLFHENVPDTFIDQVFAVMALCPQHAFQILTKRPERMLRWFQSNPYSRIMTHADRFRDALPKGALANRIGISDPNVIAARNIWLGVSVENQATADERIPLLLDTPAAVRFVSCEPLLGPIELPAHDQSMGQSYSPLDWIIVGGESGPGARPCDVRWIRSVVGQCKATRVPVFVKQLGAQPRGWCAANTPEIIGADEAAAKRADDTDGDCDYYEASEIPRSCESYGKRCIVLHDRKGGDPTEWPADLRVREFPTRR